MVTSEISSFIKKYYLDGQCESAIWNQTQNGYSVDFYTNTKDCLGKIEFNTQIDDGDTKFGVFSTSQLLSLMTITDEYCSLNIERDLKGNPIKMQISDNQYETFYHLADLNLFENVPSIDEPDSYDISINIDSDFVNKFIKAKNALDKTVNRVLIESKLNSDNEKCTEFTIGENSSHANKIKFNIISQYDDAIEPIPFNGDILKLIFQANKEFNSGYIKIFREGLMKISFSRDNINSQYFLVRQSTD